MNLNELNTRDNPKFPNMTLLDWFAGQALMGIRSSGYTRLAGLPKFATAQDAYELAEAMLEERRRRMNADAPT